MKSLLILLFVITTALADEASFTHRVTGLFSPNREADLRAAIEKVPGVKLVSLDFAHAEAVFSYDPAIAFKDTKPEQIVERFNDLLRNATRSMFGIAKLDPTPKDKLTRVEIPVAGMDCKACCLAAYEIIYQIDGVTAATASFKDGLITALIDPSRTNREALETALKARNVTLKAKP